MVSLGHICLVERAFLGLLIQPADTTRETGVKKDQKLLLLLLASNTRPMKISHMTEMNTESSDPDLHEIWHSRYIELEQILHNI